MAALAEAGEGAARRKRSFFKLILPLNSLPVSCHFHVCNFFHSFAARPKKLFPPSHNFACPHCTYPATVIIIIALQSSLSKRAPVVSDKDVPHNMGKKDVIRASDFNFLMVLGKGSFGKVKLNFFLFILRACA